MKTDINIAFVKFSHSYNMLLCNKYLIIYEFIFNFIYYRKHNLLSNKIEPIE